MLRRIDRIIRRVPSVESAVRHYRDVLGLKLIRQEKSLASFALGDGATELIFHDNADQPFEEVYFLVDDVRNLYTRRNALKLKFKSPPRQIARGFRATVEDPFGNVLLILDRRTEQSGAATIEHAATPSTLFAGIEQRVSPKKDALVAAYTKIARTADDLPYTPHFESLYNAYCAAQGDPKPTRQETWRHLLNQRKKAGGLPKFGEAKSAPPTVTPEAKQQLRDMLGTDIGKRDRLPYSDRFDKLVDEFNKTQPRPLSPHLVWRLVATLAK